MHLLGLPSLAGMGLDLLVAGLWAAVLVYWLWTRRPAADTVGIFHRELEVLQRTTPGRMTPANRLAGPPPMPAPPAGPGVPHQVAVAAVAHKRDEIRRRRRDVLSLLAASAGITLVAALVSRSSIALAFQIFTDVSLVAYVYLLSSAGRGRSPSGYASRPALYAVQQPSGPERPRGRRRVPVVVTGAQGLYEPARRVPARQVPTGSMPARRAPARPVPARRVAVGAAASPGAYGDFDSYASLA